MVAPGADPSQIQLGYSGPGRLSIETDGSLVFRRPGMEFREQAPRIFQESTHGRLAVQGHYRLLDEHTAGFEIGAYDSLRPLVIDPVISYSTFLGGSGMGAVTGVAADASGNTYVTGWTEALNFPAAQAVQRSSGGGVDRS